MTATLIETVMETIEAGIAGRALAAGAKLPSVRRQAALSGVSVSTVVEAYNRLAAKGVIVGRPGSGYYVEGGVVPLTLAAVGPDRDRAVDPLWVSRQSLDADEGYLRPGCGWLPASWLPQEPLRKALRAMARHEGGDLTDYGTPAGSPGLRALIARRLSARGVAASPEQIVLTESGTQAIDLFCRFLLEPGDTVLLDDPCYFNFQAQLRAHRVQMVGVPYGKGGPDLDRFAAILAEHRPKLYITNSGVHNPTSGVLSPRVAHRVLMLAQDHDLTIVEDEIFADFETRPAPRLAGLDGLERVASIGSFSKTLSAAARCGFIALRRDWVDGLVDLKLATGFGGGRLNEAIVHHVLSESAYRRHIDTLIANLAKARAEARTRLAALGIVPEIEAEAGMFLWCRLPDAIDAGALSRAALDHDIVLAPGNVFSVGEGARSLMRFNVTQMGDGAVYDVLATLLQEARVAEL